MPSAKTTNPLAALMTRQSSLCGRTLPTSLKPSICNARLTSTLASSRIALPGGPFPTNSQAYHADSLRLIGETALRNAQRCRHTAARVVDLQQGVWVRHLRG